MHEWDPKPLAHATCRTCYPLHQISLMKLREKVKNCIQWLQSNTPSTGPCCSHCAPEHRALCDCTGHTRMQAALGSASAIPPGNPYCSDLPEPCSYEGRVFQDGEDWPLSRCAKCVCRNGVAQCFTAQCHPLFCNQVRKTASEWILHRLLTSLFRNLGVSSEILSGRPRKYWEREAKAVLFSLHVWRPPLRDFFYP